MSRLPPGIILDEDGKPCKACNSLSSMRAFSKFKGKPSTPPSPSSSSSSSSSGSTRSSPPSSTSSTSTASAAAAAAAAAAISHSPNHASHPPSDCPPDVETLGRSTWTFLHTTAAYYPITPSPAQQSSMLSLLTSISQFYPCKTCAADFREDMGKNLPDVSGREGLSRWLCERHNEVNWKLGKGGFDCSKVGERWREGWKDGSCD